MSHHLYQLTISGTLLILCLSVLAYRFHRRDARPEILRAMWLVSGMGAVAFLISALSSGATTPEWLQGWIYTLRAVPYHAACTIIALLVVRSVGNKYPRLIPWLRAAPWSFGAAVISALVMSLVFPVPALEEYTRVAWWELALLKARNVPELLYPLLTGVVFAVEMVRRETPSRILRLQYFSLAVASSCFVGLVLVAGYGTYLRVNAVPAAAQLPAVEWQLSLQTYLVGLGCLGYFLGVALYHSDQERERLVSKFERWVGFRHDLELAFDQNFGDHLVLGKGLGHSNVDELYYLSACGLNGSSGSGDGYSQWDEDRGEKLFLLLGLLTVSHERYELARDLYEAQQDVIRSSDLASRIFVHMDRNFRYDIQEDAVFQAIRPALSIAGGTRDYSPLADQPQWVQLAVLLASETGLVAPEARGSQYDRAVEHVEPRVREAYVSSSRISATREARQNTSKGTGHHT